MAADDLRVRFGRRCRALRRRRKLSQLDMVRNFDVSLSHYQKIERGDLDVRLSTAQKLAECFDVTSHNCGYHDWSIVIDPTSGATDVCYHDATTMGDGKSRWYLVTGKIELRDADVVTDGCPSRGN